MKKYTAVHWTNKTYRIKDIFENDHLPLPESLSEKDRKIRNKSYSLKDEKGNSALKGKRYFVHDLQLVVDPKEVAPKGAIKSTNDSLKINLMDASFKARMKERRKTKNAIDKDYVSKIKRKTIHTVRRTNWNRMKMSDVPSVFSDKPSKRKTNFEAMQEVGKLSIDFGADEDEAKEKGASKGASKGARKFYTLKKNKKKNTLQIEDPPAAAAAADQHVAKRKNKPSLIDDPGAGDEGTGSTGSTGRQTRNRGAPTQIAGFFSNMSNK